MMNYYKRDENHPIGKPISDMNCEYCGQKMSVFSEAPSIEGLRICNNCYHNRADEIRGSVNEEQSSISEDELNKIITTTESYSKDFLIKQRFGVISSESALGMNLFRDIFTNIRDLVGGKSISTQKVLKDLKTNAFIDLKEQAYHLGANAVIAIDLNYSEFSGSGKTMLFLVVTGTAVQLEESP